MVTSMSRPIHTATTVEDAVCLQPLPNFTFLASGFPGAYVASMCGASPCCGLKSGNARLLFDGLIDKRIKQQTILLTNL